jgi:hypothetical protein
MKLAIAILAVVFAAGATLFFLNRSRLSGSTKARPKFSDEVYSRNYEAKQKAIERILGPMHDIVGHAIIPFQIGGAVDMYYFPNGIPGTGFATMELLEPDGSGPKPNRIGTYELVAFTKLKVPPPGQKGDTNAPFNKIERRMCGILTTVGRYSYEAVLNPGETCEVPGGEGEPTKCLMLDEYRNGAASFEINGKKHCLLLCVEVFRSEMEFAMQHGSAAVLKKLKEKGYYPYSDLDREPVF